MLFSFCCTVNWSNCSAHKRTTVAHGYSFSMQFFWKQFQVGQWKPDSLEISQQMEMVIEYFIKDSIRH